MIRCVCVCAILWGAGAPAQDFQGSWEAEFNHDDSEGTFPNPEDRQYWPSNVPFDPQHLVLIPKGPHAGKVLMWDGYHVKVGTSWVLRWSILDPSTNPPAFLNFTLLIPGDRGHFHCGGHAWTDNGDLIVMGGEHPQPSPNPAKGSVLTLRYRPDQGPYGTWQVKEDMVERRWYPLAVAFWDKMIGIFGGWNANPPPPSDGARNTYEVYNSTADRWDRIGTPPVRKWNGPQNNSPLDQLPRLFQLSELCYAAAGFPVWPLGRIFLVPMRTTLCASVAHQELNRPGSGPGRWDDASYPAKLSPTDFHNTPVVLLPGETDLVVAVGGSGASKKVQYIDMKAQDPTWQYMASLQTARRSHNVVILADGSLLAVRGEDGANQPIKTSELYKNGEWVVIDDGQTYSPRADHSMAIVLPNGKVLLAGGEGRTADYQLYSPWYLDPTCRAVIQPPTPSTLTYALPATAYFEWTAPGGSCPGVELQKVVLVAPGSVTHHFDQHQRYVELNVTQVEPPANGQPGWVKFDPPKNATYAPPGYYMMFLVTDGGVPSAATWVRLQ